MSDSPTLTLESAAKAALENEVLFGNGPPRWLEGRRSRSGKTSVQAEAERHLLVKRLRRFGRKNPLALELANRIEACRPHQRCKSGACPECSRAWQRWFVVAAKRFIAKQARSGIVTLVSPIHADGIVEQGDLNQ